MERTFAGSRPEPSVVPPVVPGVPPSAPQNATGRSFSAVWMLGGVVLGALLTGGTLYLGSLRLIPLFNGAAQPPQAVIADKTSRPGNAAPAPPANAPSGTANASAAPSGDQAAAATQAEWTSVGTFGSWEARCTTPPGTTEQLCTALLQVVEGPKKTVIMAWIVGPDAKGTLQTAFQTPTGVNVANGIAVKIGDGPLHKVPYQSCASQQCTAIATMSDGLIKEMSTAAKADVSLTAMNGRTLSFSIPVNGFDEALAAIRR